VSLTLAFTIRSESRRLFKETGKLITNLERLTEVVNRLAPKGVKEYRLSPKEEKLLVLLTRLIEDYERKRDPMPEAA
jgi:hypothetical protein